MVSGYSGYYGYFMVINMVTKSCLAFTMTIKGSYNGYYGYQRVKTSYYGYLPSWLNLLPQPSTLQGYGFSPVCVSMCLFRLVHLVNLW